MGNGSEFRLLIRFPARRCQLPSECALQPVECMWRRMSIIQLNSRMRGASEGYNLVGICQLTKLAPPAAQRPVAPLKARHPHQQVVWMDFRVLNNFLLFTI